MGGNSPRDEELPKAMVVALMVVMVIVGLAVLSAIAALIITMK